VIDRQPALSPHDEAVLRSLLSSSTCGGAVPLPAAIARVSRRMVSGPTGNVSMALYLHCLGSVRTAV